MFDFILCVVEWIFTFIPRQRLKAVRRRSKELQRELLETLAVVNAGDTDVKLQAKGLRLTDEYLATNREFRRLVDVVYHRRHAAVTVTTVICRAVITGKYWVVRIFWTPLRWLYRI